MYLYNVLFIVDPQSMARHLVRDRDAEMEASISSSSTKRPKRGQKAVVYQLERNGPPLNPRPTGLAGLNEFERANQAPKQVPLPQLTESDSVDNTSGVSIFSSRLVHARFLS
jgi:hypothetical protein